MCHEDYKYALFNDCQDNPKLASSIHFEIKHHNVYTVEKKKKYLTSYNDKKYFKSPLESLSFGHKNIPT